MHKKMEGNCGLISSKNTMTAPRSMTSSDVFQAQEVLEPLSNIAIHHRCTDSLTDPKLWRFSSRFIALAHLITSGPRREATLNENLLQLLESCCKPEDCSDAASPRNPYPSLNLLATSWSDRRLKRQQRLKNVLNEVNIHWGTPQNQEHLLTELDKYSREGEMGMDKGHTTTWNDDSERDQCRVPFFNVKAQASSIFYALDACRKACGCDSAHGYRVRLALETHIYRGILASPKFTLHISTTPGGCAWSEVFVETVSPNSSTSRIEEISQTLRKGPSDTEYQPTERFCNLLKELDPAEVQLPLRVVEGNLLWKADYIQGKYSTSQLEDPISLKSLIEERGNLGERLELTISIKLAHAALHLERGPWMKTAWDKQSIQFLRNSDQHISPQPFFFTHIPSENVSSQGQRSTLFRHPDAGLLALGIMLLELRLGRTIETLTASGRAGYRGWEGRNPLIVAKKVYNDFKNHFPEDFRLAVEACLDIRFGGTPAYRVDDEEFAERIQERIIAPLEREFAHFCRVEVSSRAFEDALQDALLNVLEKPPIAVETVSSQNPTKESPSAGSLYYGTTVSTSVSSRSMEEQYADEFMRKQFEVYKRAINDVLVEEDEIVHTIVPGKVRKQALSNREFPQPGYRIRVAVLDTGIHLQHRLLPQSRIKDIRTWLDGADGDYAPNGGDEDGHGTHVAHLVLQIARDSDLYVARIARQGVPDNSLQISKAVMYAAKEWKVDIITLSFGMPREEEFGREELRAALDAAKSAGVLLFAAASNGGGSVHRAFPARLPFVFCVHATDGKGNPCVYNPTPEKNQLNLATLGEAIEAAWPYVGNDSGLVRKSGTSFATPIAAGFAAVVLLYARQRLPDKAKVFKWDDKMREVFERASSRFGKRGGYNYFSLEMLLDRPHQHIVGQLLEIAED